MSIEKLSTEEKLNKLGVQFESSRLSDVPNGSYVWFLAKDGKR
jgi:hypothetical protein